MGEHRRIPPVLFRSARRLVMSSLSYNPPPPAHATSAGLIDSWIEGWETALTGAKDCFTTAFSRGPGSPYVSRWLELRSQREAPSWTTPHEVVFEGPVARLRDFSVSSKAGLVPTL